MNWVDAVIIASLLLALWNGYRRGALLQAFSWGGLAAGLVIGLALAPHVVSLFHISPTNQLRPVYTIVALLGISFVIEGVVASVGIRLRRRITHVKLNKTDSAVGAVVAGFLSLLLSWIAGGVLAHAPVATVRTQIKQSTILKALDSFAPPPKSLLATIGRFLNNTGFPQGLEELNPSLAPGVAPPDPSVANNQKILADAAITYKIEGKGCGGVVDGSGFPIGNQMIVTAAHVVAGTSDTQVLPRNGGSYSGIVVYMNTDVDIAIIRSSAPGVLSVDPNPAQYNQDGAAIGYPHGGQEKVSAGRVRARTDAVGNDIYGNKRVTRTIYVLRADVVPGNSGGPFVDTSGRVRGMIFAAAQDQSQHESYALAENEIFAARDAASGKTSEVSSRGSCAI
ncbi:MAG: MarP family serine protease [Actinomycetota bacterium]